MFTANLTRVALAATVLMLLAVSPARADWLRAESERFIIYSDGDERTLRHYVQKLETFDRVLRLFMGLSMDEAPPRKLPIYLIGHERELDVDRELLVGKVRRAAQRSGAEVSVRRLRCVAGDDVGVVKRELHRQITDAHR